MFFDELYDSFIKYSKLSKLKKVQEKKLLEINQTVSIRDLIVRTRIPHCYGESKEHTNHYPQSSEIRIRAQINTLFNLANEDHIARNYERNPQGKLQLKKGKENYITRLSTHEFSFYTDKPLTVQEYQRLYIDIITMAEKLEPNVHILLSSFAVKDTEGVLMNMSLFVEGGKPPIIHAFSKNSASTVDINYSGAETVFSQSKQVQVGFHAQNITKKTGETVSTGSVFEVTAQGGARYTQAIDVCLDHLTGHSKDLVSRLVVSDAAPDEVFPEQVEQIVSSNCVYIDQESRISDKIVHADPNLSMLGYGAQLGSKSLTQEAIGRITDNEFSSMQIKETTRGYKLIKPPFGSDCHVEVFEERSAGKYYSKLQASISKHNEAVCARRIDFETQSKLMLDPNFKLISKIAHGETLKTDRTKIISDHINQMESKILKNCRVGFFQKIFRTQEYVQKMQVKKIIESSFAKIRETVETHQDASIFVLRVWKEDLNFRLYSELSPSSELKQILQQDTKEILNEAFQKSLGFKTNLALSQSQASFLFANQEKQSELEHEDPPLSPLTPKT